MDCQQMGSLACPDARIPMFYQNKGLPYLQQLNQITLLVLFTLLFGMDNFA